MNRQALLHQSGSALTRGLELLSVHSRAAVSKRVALGLPTCCDHNNPDLRKLSALMEEVGEVARAIQDGAPLDELRSELLDVATAATGWAGSLEGRC